MTRIAYAAADRPTPRHVMLFSGFTPAANVERLVFAALVFALGVRASLPRGDELLLVLCLLAAPLWMRSLLSSRWARAFTVVMVAALISGLLLSSISASDHEVLASSRTQSVATVALLLTASGVIAQAARTLSVRAVGLCLGAGMLVDGVANPGELGAMNPLKFAVLVPVTVIVFSLVYGAAAIWQLLALLVMAVVSVEADARAFLGTAIVAAVIIVWQMVRARSPKRTWALTAVFLVCLVFAVYNLATALLINGYLGSDSQERSVEQVQTSGSILLGGRPEVSAMVALIGHDAAGLGFGVVANNQDIEVAKTGMASINYDPNNNYVDQFMFGSAVELHSVVGDLWAMCGIAGLVLVALVLIKVFTHIARLAASRKHDVLLLFFAVWTIWNLLFSPLGSAVTVLFLTMGLLFSFDDIRPNVARPRRRASC